MYFKQEEDENPMHIVLLISFWKFLKPSFQFFFFSQRPGLDDYRRGRNHKKGDRDSIPLGFQIALYKFAKTTFVPDVLRFLETRNPIFRKCSIDQVELNGFEFGPYILEGFVSDEVRYDLDQLDDLSILPLHGYSKFDGRRLIGSAIRICKAIGKQEHADTFKKIIGDCFTPDEQQDPTDPRREYFDLLVEPSTGSIQSECCKDE
jgi:hypothetical protein